jgi:hypothetical protein
VAPTYPRSVRLQPSFLRRQVYRLKKERTENQGEERRPEADLRRRKQNKNHYLCFFYFAGDVTSHRQCRKREEEKTS